MESHVCTAGVHIFDSNNIVAVDNFFIYTLIESKETYVDFVQMLRIENHFNDRCGKFKIDVNDIELTVLENRTMKPTVQYEHT
jgi:hypothetical protein